MKFLKIFLLFFIFNLTVFANSVIFVKNIYPHEKKGFFNALKKLLLGKRDLQAKPFAIGVLSNGDVVVSDVDKGMVLLLTADGEIKKVVSRVGKIPLATPVSIWIDKKDNIYIVDSVRKGVLKFDKDLSSARILIADNSKRFTSLCIVDNFMFLTDTENHKIACYSLEGKFIFSFGKRGIKEGEFNYPTAISTDGNFLFVLDSLNFRVQVFDLKGNFLRKFGKLGDGSGYFSKPKGIAVVNGKFIAVTDVVFDNVQLFDKTGNFLTFFGKNGDCEKCFVMPSGIFSQNGLIYICDRWNQRISIWRVEAENE
ncbi:conserved hypothetical protein [Thermotomaculum hydrothermale]|uniref:NHL repeat containing protein n=1 Tax=Thermotomaculum hydrothermale TaxID=981385 RepID=A0A7R6SYN0_9BACT|nr:6-bladed beta-propeller [Thermotomaculum hydrothermale]BBB32830.1 conserved hypothetical protein [Thermotomaculum hydrothermale]